VADDEDAAALQRDLELRKFGLGFTLVSASALRLVEQPRGLLGNAVRALLVREGRAEHLAAAFEDDGRSDL
jgi:hypothetical protein